MNSDRKRAAVEVAVVLGLFLVAGLLGALLWHWWWAPAPEGFVFDGAPYFGPDEEFRSTGTYVAVAAPIGLVLGVVLAWVLDRDERVTLAALGVGSVLASVLMMMVGHLLGPDSAAAVARGVADFEEIDADLRVQPGPAWLVLPVSTLVGAVVVLLAFVKDD